MIRYYIGGDESYDVGNDGNFILNFFVLNNEKDFTYLNSEVRKIITKLKYTEVKSRHLNHPSKLSLFSAIKKTYYKNYVYKQRLEPNWQVKKYYSEALSLFLEKFEEDINQNRDVGEDIKIVFILDILEGEKFQLDCLHQIRNFFKQKNIKCVPEFTVSDKVEIVQIADVIAGENRKFFRGKSKFKTFPLKNKSLNQLS